MNLIESIGDRERIYSASLIVVIPIILSIMFFYIRQFAVGVQDRVIRAEENMRYYILTGKFLPAELSIEQIAALRFAPDEEFTGLVEKATRESMKPDAIKRQIRQWKADHHRI